MAVVINDRMMLIPVMSVDNAGLRLYSVATMLAVKNDGMAASKTVTCAILFLTLVSNTMVSIINGASISLNSRA